MIYFKTYGGYLYNNITDLVAFKYADWECELFHMSRDPPESILWYMACVVWTTGKRKLRATAVEF